MKLDFKKEAIFLYLMAGGFAFVAIAASIASRVGRMVNMFLGTHYLLAMVLFIIAVILGIYNVIMLKKKGKYHSLIFAILITVIPLFLLGYGVKFYYNDIFANAIREGNIPRIKEMIAKGCNVNGESFDGQNMLILTFSYGNLKEKMFRGIQQTNPMERREVGDKIFIMLEILIDNGADINALSSCGEVPIHNAVRINQIRIVKMLVEKGAHINLKDKFGIGDSPLHVAVEYTANAEMIEILIANGANVNARNGNGKTPLMLALEGGKTEKAELLRKYGAK